MITREVSRKRSHFISSIFRLGFKRTIFYFSILFLIFLMFLVFPSQKKSDIGKSLTETYWPRVALEDRNFKILFPVIFKSAINSIIFLFTEPNVPTLYVDIKLKNYEKLMESRKAALDLGGILDVHKKYVPAKIRIGKENFPIKIRLKGDNIGHQKGSRWSFRVSTKSGASILGMKNFSIQTISKRNWTAEPLFFHHVNLYNILTPKYTFAKVIVNGKEWGLMALEERAGKELLERSKRREGVIFHFNDKPKWESMHSGKLSNLYSTFNNLEIISYYQNSVRRKESLAIQYKRGLFLLEGWKEKRFSTSNVFDIKKWADLLALSELWQARHHLKPHNLRLYYNPVNDRIEPIVFDRMAHFFNDEREIEKNFSIIGVNFVDSMLQDNQFRNQFYISLTKVSEDINRKKIFSYLRKKDQEILKKIRHEKFYINDFPIDMLQKRGLYFINSNIKSIFSNSQKPNYLRKIVNENNYFPSLAYGWFYINKNELTIVLKNQTNLLLSLCGLNVKNTPGSENNYKLNINENISILKKSNPFKPINPFTLKFSLDDNKFNSINRHTMIEVCLEEKPGENRKNVIIFAGPLINNNIGLRPESFEVFSKKLNKYPFIFLNKDNQMIVEEGFSLIKENLIVPESIDVYIKPGAEVKLSNNASLIIYSNLHARSNKQKTIKISGNNSTDLQAQSIKSTSGIAVIGSGDNKVDLYGVAFENLSPPYIHYWNPTGSVTISKSKVKMNNIVFSDIVAEDALNIIDSSIDLKNIKFDRVSSDALDCDFCDGKIFHSNFHFVGGDSLDFSGSNIEMSDSILANITDKAISVGEKSYVIANNISISDVGIGVASKDSSVFEVKNIKIRNFDKVGIISFLKKSEYNIPGTVIAHDVDIIKEENSIKAQHNGKVIIEGRIIKTEKIDVQSLY